MRRFDVERNDTGGGRGFRIIEAGGRYLEPLTPPPPPRAPEPYKVASSSSALGRAHRRSSFVIIAETRPATPSSRSPSPSLPPTGRVSPFRGRGFKGPLPRAQSRPQSPDDRRRIAYGRYDRRASVSQQNSPKRSLIPQPTRRRSSSLTKNNGRRSSPKFGRRAPVQIPRSIANSSSRSSANNSNVTRKHSFRAPDLSPIQGTPTKPYDESVERYRPTHSVVSKVSPVKTRNSLAIPKLNGHSRRAPSQARSPGKVAAKRQEPRRFVEEKKSNAEDDSRTRIPVRRGSLVGKNGSNLPTSRFVVNNPTKPAARAVKPRSDDTERETTTSGGGEDLPGSGESVNENSGHELSSGSQLVDPPVDSKHRENDLGLMDLLKQSSGAMGTSSMVNTTTTTAVQPLQIDAAPILLEKDRENADKRRTTISASPGSADPSSTTGPFSTVASETPAAKVSKAASRSDATNENRKTESREKEVVGSSTNSTSQKNPSRVNNVHEPTTTVTTTTTTTTTKIAPTKEQSNAANIGQAPREKQLVGATGSSKKNLHASRNVPQDGSRDARVTSAKPGPRVINSNGGAVNNLPKSVVKEANGSGKEETSPAAVVSVNSVSEKVATAGSVVVAAGVGALHKKSDSRGSVPSRDDAERTVSRNVGAAKDPITTETQHQDGVGVGRDDNKKSHRANGSENSLKSLNGLSNISAENARSTDTGVSLDTVRGLSSAREKKGVHAIKRSEEIETLSGNVMHLERNGEPAVLDIAEGPEVPQDQTRLDRFKNSLSRLSDRLPSMRCLGCRRGQKARTWMEERRGPSVETRRNEESTSGPAASGNSRCDRIWTSWKNACRCTRWRECKCCRRATRIAPAESTSCCPPERRCGALCGRLFSCCKCERAEAQHTRSIRAKHSLTSVAPPPLSEEPKAKIPEVLVEHNSVMRGAIPCLPVPIAWFCLVWNVLLPGSGTVWSGLFNLCIGQPRFSISAGPRARFGALVVNVIVGVSQFFTVLFCLVGWGWSIWWGVTMIRLARKYKRYRASEAASSDLEARSGEQTGLPAGVPSQALRGMERAR